jgi:hypothetical protein
MKIKLEDIKEIINDISEDVIGFDEREASEFVEIFYNETFKSE